MPFPVLLLTVLLEMSTVIGPLVVSVFIPPPVLLAIVTWSNEANTLPPAPGLMTTPLLLFPKTLFETTSLAAVVGVTEIAVLEVIMRTLSRMSPAPSWYVMPVGEP